MFHLQIKKKKKRLKFWSNWLDIKFFKIWLKFKGKNPNSSLKIKAPSNLFKVWALSILPQTLFFKKKTHTHNTLVHVHISLSQNIKKKKKKTQTHHDSHATASTPATKINQPTNQSLIFMERKHLCLLGNIIICIGFSFSLFVSFIFMKRVKGVDVKTYSI